MAFFGAQSQGPQRLYPPLTPAAKEAAQKDIKASLEVLKPKLSALGITAVLEDHPTSRLFAVDPDAENPNRPKTWCPKDEDWAVVFFEGAKREQAQLLQAAGLAYHNHHVHADRPLNVWYYEQYLPEVANCLRNLILHLG
jgi:hypothetical protein